MVRYQEIIGTDVKREMASQAVRSHFFEKPNEVIQMAKPEKRFRCGGCETAVFENEITRGGKTMKIKKVSFQKRYKDPDGEWKTTHSLDINEIPKAILALSKAYEYLVLGNGAEENPNSMENSY